MYLQSDYWIQSNEEGIYKPKVLQATLWCVRSWLALSHNTDNTFTGIHYFASTSLSYTVSKTIKSAVIYMPPLLAQQSSHIAKKPECTNGVRYWWICLTDGQVSNRRSLIKRLIGGDLGWEHELWPEVDSLKIRYTPMVLLLQCTSGLYVFISKMFRVIFGLDWARFNVPSNTL